MTEFREIRGANGLVAYQAGAFGTPTHWVIARHGSFVCATNSEVDALIMLELLATVPAVEWAAARDTALRDMGHRRAA